VGVVVSSVAVLDRVRQRTATTPGKLTVVTVGLVVLGLVSGLVGLVAVQRRAALVRDVGQLSGPLSVHAQNLYRSLSDADATAASAFLTNGVEPPALRQRYLDDLAQASSALSIALRDADDRAADKLAVLARQLPVYTGLVETARSYNRQGLPLGAAYLREASGLMRGTLLPTAQQLFDLGQQRLTAAQRDAAAFPWAVLLLGVVTLGGLIATQALLARRTNRVLNVGLVTASLATLIGLTWSTAALASAADSIDTGRRDGSAQVQVLANARVAALQARADEALTLIARGDGAAFEHDFTAVMERLIGKDGNGGLLAQAVAQAPTAADRATAEEAREQARKWQAAHKKVRELDDGGQYLDAVKLATDSGADSPSGLFGRLDAAVTRGITATNERFDERAAEAGDALGGADAAVVLLTVVLVVAVVAGMQRRIGEYR
jgi:hypothetical protein